MRNCRYYYNKNNILEIIIILFLGSLVKGNDKAQKGIDKRHLVSIGCF